MGKEKDAPEKEFVERYDPIDAIESTHYGMVGMHELADSERYKLGDLLELRNKWSGQASLPNRSERSRVECLKMADLATFEAAYRTGNVELLREVRDGESDMRLSEFLSLVFASEISDEIVPAY